MPATIVLLAVAGLVVTGDASTKAVAHRLPPAGVGHPSFGLRLVLNRRPRFARLTAGAAAALLAVLTMAALTLVAVADTATTVAIALGLALGGALGNLVDRLRRNAVVDFVVLGRWPPFNGADAALVGGAVLALVSAIT
jgi:signal peptidase II